MKKNRRYQLHKVTPLGTYIIDLMFCAQLVYLMLLKLTHDSLVVKSQIWALPTWKSSQLETPKEQHHFWEHFRGWLIKEWMSNIKLEMVKVYFHFCRKVYAFFIFCRKVPNVNFSFRSFPHFLSPLYGPIQNLKAPSIAFWESHNSFRAPQIFCWQFPERDSFPWCQRWRIPQFHNFAICHVLNAL